MADDMFVMLEQRYKAVCQELHDVTAARNQLALKLGDVERRNAVLEQGHDPYRNLLDIEARDQQIKELSLRLGSCSEALTVMTIERDAADEALRLANVEIQRRANEAKNWEQSAAEFCKGMEFYRDLVRQIGEPFGVAARTSDDGSIQQDVLALKVPELVIEQGRRLGDCRTALRVVHMNFDGSGRYAHMRARVMELAFDPPSEGAAVVETSVRICGTENREHGVRCDLPHGHDGRHHGDDEHHREWSWCE